MCNYREVGVIKADLEEYKSYVLDSSFTEEQKLKFSEVCGDIRRELRNERTRLYKQRKAAEKKALCN